MMLNLTQFLSLPEIIGLTAGFLGLSASLQIVQKKLKLQIGASSYIWAIHFFLLGGFTAALMQIGIGSRTLLSIYLKRSIFAISSYVICTSAMFISMMYFTWVGPMSLLPTFAAINSTIAYLLNNIQMRLMFLLSSLCWIISGYYLKSYPIILAEIIGICMNLLGVWRVLRGEFNSPTPIIR
jgi:hypothetical protein